MKIRKKSRTPFGCSEFEQYIPVFIRGELPDNLYDKFIQHYEKCNECNEELEILYLVHHTVNSHSFDSGSLNLKEKMAEHMDDMREQVYRRYKFRFIKYSAIATAEVTTFVALIGYILYLLGIF